MEKLWKEEEISKAERELNKLEDEIQLQLL